MSEWAFVGFRLKLRRDLGVAQVKRPPIGAASMANRFTLPYRRTLESAARAPASTPRTDPLMPGATPPAPKRTASGFFNRAEVFGRAGNRRGTPRCLGVGLPCQGSRKQDRRRRSEGNCYFTHRFTPRTALSGAHLPPLPYLRHFSRLFAGLNERGQFGARSIRHARGPIGEFEGWTFTVKRPASAGGLAIRF